MTTAAKLLGAGLDAPWLAGFEPLTALSGFLLDAVARMGKGAIDGEEAKGQKRGDWCHFCRFLFLGCLLVDVTEELVVLSFNL